VMTLREALPEVVAICDHLAYGLISQIVISNTQLIICQRPGCFFGGSSAISPRSATTVTTETIHAPGPSGRTRGGEQDP
jgi:hypothetical protein